MAIRFVLSDDGAERLSFAPSALLEAVLSLHVLVGPKHHPLQHPFVRAMRRLPAPLRRDVQRFSYLYRLTITNCVLPSGDGAYLTFEDELDRLVRLPADRLRYELTRPLRDHGGVDVEHARLDDRSVQDAVLRAARRISPRGVQAVRLALEDPRAAVAEFAEILAAYWDRAFGAEWARLEPMLADAVTEAGGQIAAGGPFAFFQGLGPRLRIDPSRNELGIDVPHDHRIELTGSKTLCLVPSYFVWPHVLVNCDPPWPLTVVFAAPGVRAAARREMPPDELLRTLRAVADRTRLQALRLIAERSRSTQELAPLLNISEAGLSKHLRLLADAGLVTSRRDGYYVLYSLEPDQLLKITRALPHFLRV